MRLMLVLFCLTSLISVSLPAQASLLKILYEDRPPYHVTNDDGTVSGIVSGRISQALDAAGIEAIWVHRSGNSQIETIKRGKEVVCTPGWFKKPEREEFAKFSLPVYQDLPQVIVMRADNSHRFPHRTLAEVFADPDLTMGAKLGYSYGSFVDGLMESLSPSSVRTSQDADGMIRMLVGRRFDYLIAAPEEFNILSERLGIAGEDIVYSNLSDFPAGNKRYLMCSKQVPDEIIERFNKALATIE